MFKMAPYYGIENNGKHHKDIEYNYFALLTEIILIYFSLKIYSILYSLWNKLGNEYCSAYY